MTTFLIIYGILFYFMTGFIFMDWFNDKTFERYGEFNKTSTNIFICLMWSVLVAALVIIATVYVLWILLKRLFKKVFKKKNDKVDNVDETNTDNTDNTDSSTDTPTDASVEPVPDSSAE